VLVRCWFSDGGITSNFPIHFFDSLFPRRPTFGITLRPYHAAHPESDVYRPDKDATTRVPVVKNTTTVGGFFHGILDTMQNWSDDAQCMLPGFWDRVVELHLHDDEGGMNLAMPADTIAVVAERGRQAAECLDDFDFPQHRWARYLTSMSELQAHAVRLGTVLTKRLPDGSDGYTEFVKTYGHEKHRFHREPEWCDAAAAMTSGLVTAMDDKLHDFTQSPPRPDPDLRVTPHF
jgi:hypothetical protein